MNAMGCSPRTTDWLCWRMRELEMGTWKIAIFGSFVLLSVKGKPLLLHSVHVGIAPWSSAQRGQFAPGASVPAASRGRGRGQASDRVRAAAAAAAGGIFSRGPLCDAAAGGEAAPAAAAAASVPVTVDAENNNDKGKLSFPSDQEMEVVGSNPGKEHIIS